MERPVHRPGLVTRESYDNATGVPVIVATLIHLITIPATESPALMVSHLQKNGMIRKSSQALVRNEDLRIISLTMDGTIQS